VSIPPELIGIPVVITIPAIVIVVRMWLAHKERMAGLTGPKENASLLDARLERVEQTVESIAIEMERVSEGQRFVTKLLSERARETSAAPPREPVITPH
jgi:GTPase